MIDDYTISKLSDKKTNKIKQNRTKQEQNMTYKMIFLLDERHVLFLPHTQQTSILTLCQYDKVEYSCR